ncbi:MAG: hypothetical protein KC464_27075 [Myxococcales bacterium]|nr:hypothetical protein [Myxococcales bacterium]
MRLGYLKDLTFAILTHNKHLRHQDAADLWATFDTRLLDRFVEHGDTGNGRFNTLVAQIADLPLSHSTRAEHWKAMIIARGEHALRNDVPAFTLDHLLVEERTLWQATVASAAQKLGVPTPSVKSASLPSAPASTGRPSVAIASHGPAASTALDEFRVDGAYLWDDVLATLRRWGYDHLKRGAITAQDENAPVFVFLSESNSMEYRNCHDNHNHVVTMEVNPTETTLNQRLRASKNGTPVGLFYRRAGASHFLFLGPGRCCAPGQHFIEFRY